MPFAPLELKVKSSEPCELAFTGQEVPARF